MTEAQIQMAQISAWCRKATVSAGKWYKKETGGKSLHQDQTDALIAVVVLFATAGKEWISFSMAARASGIQRDRHTLQALADKGLVIIRDNTESRGKGRQARRVVSISPLGAAVCQHYFEVMGSHWNSATAAAKLADYLNKCSNRQAA